MATILVTHGIPAEGFSLLSGEKIVIPKPLMHFSMDELAALIPAADAVVACGALPGEIIRRGTKLRIIAGYGAGYDGVDVRAAAECGIPVTNLPDTVTDSTAELAIGLMLAVSRRIGENSLRAREEAPENLFGMGRSMGRSLRGQTLGLLGCGRIGKRTAEIAAALGMRCIGYSRHGVNHPQVESVTLPELLAQSDVLSLHCPLTQETRRLLDRSALADASAPYQLLLTTSLPRDDELEQTMQHAQYRLIRRSGFIQSNTFNAEPFKKQTQYYLAAGATCTQRYHGDLYTVAESGNHPVYRYSKPMFLGVKA